jgi:hypothetical protein
MNLSGSLLTLLPGWYNALPDRTSGPACPGDPSAQAEGDGAVNLTWEPVPEATSYPIVRSGPASEAVVIANVSATSTTYLDTNVTPGESYEYTIHSWNGTDISRDCPTLEITTVAFLSGWTTVAAAAVLATGAYVAVRRRS